MSTNDPREVIAQELEDTEVRYSMNLVRLVDGVSTYELRYDGQNETFKFETTGECYAHIATRRRQARAQAILAALAASGLTIVPAGAWPYGSCELAAEVPCNPFNCCEICPVPGAGRHANTIVPAATGDVGLRVHGLSLEVAQTLVEQFGGEDTDMTVEFVRDGHSGTGFYCWCTEYPEDGSTFIGAPSEFSPLAALSPDTKEQSNG